MFESFYPNDFPENYICVSTGAEAPGLVYDKYQEVFALVEGILERHELAIVQVGSREDKRISSHFVNSSDLKHISYVLSQAKLFVGNDTLLLDICKDYGIKVVGLYGPTPPRESKAVESHRNNLLPSFNPNETNKTINLIHPEEVANSILGAIGEPKLKLKTICFGGFYNSPVFDICPDHCTGLVFSANSIFNLRMDWYHNPNFLVENLHRLDKSAIFLNQELGLNVLAHFKSKISQVVIFIDEWENIDWINAVAKLGIHYELVTNKRGQELSDLRLRLFDFAINQEIWGEKISEVKPGDQYYTKRVILSKDGLFLSESHFARGISSQDRWGIVTEDDIKDELFWKDSCYYWWLTNSED